MESAQPYIFFGVVIVLTVAYLAAFQFWFDWSALIKSKKNTWPIWRLWPQMTTEEQKVALRFCVPFCVSNLIMFGFGVIQFYYILF